MHRMVFELKARRAEPADIGQLLLRDRCRADPADQARRPYDRHPPPTRRRGGRVRVGRHDRPHGRGRYAWADLPEEVRLGLPAAEDLDPAVHQAVRALGCLPAPANQAQAIQVPDERTFHSAAPVEFCFRRCTGVKDRLAGVRGWGLGRSPPVA